MDANYVLLDAARLLDHILVAWEKNPEHVCLYRGNAERNMKFTAPYLFTYKPESEFAQWLEESGKENFWQIFVKASVDLETLRRHFRKFLLVKTEDGKEVYFRFYDARVLQYFLPTCNQEQLKNLFGPVEAFMMEDETTGSTISFHLKIKSGFFSKEVSLIVEIESLTNHHS